MKKVDLHVHTIFSSFKHLKILRAHDSYNDPVRVYERARAAGCDFVAITDHDTIDGALDLLSRRPELEPTVIIGEEVETWFPETGQWVHVNVFDVDEATHRDITHLRRDVRDLVGYLRGRGLVHALNHPLQSYRLQKAPMSYVEEVLDLFTHVEVGNSSVPASQNRAAALMVEYARRHGLKRIAVGGSDAHGLGPIGRGYTLAPGESPRAWLASVAAGDCAIEGREIGMTGFVAEVYKLVARYYRHIATSKGRRGMSAANIAAAAGFVPVCLMGWPLFLSIGSHLRMAAISRVVHRSLDQAGQPPLEPLARWTGEPEG